MIKNEKKNGIMDIIKDVLSYIPQIISASIVPSIAKSTEIVLNNIETRIMQIEKSIARRVSSFFIMFFGGIFLIFAIFFSLKEYLEWSNSMAFFTIGIFFL
jgi:VIT1/CCC1 family predicted Fe2+/Mn2+ transporter